MTNLQLEKKRRVLHIRLTRLEKRNALTADMCNGIVEAIDAVQDDPDIGAVMLAADGPVFSSGMDLDEAVTDKASDLGPIHERLFSIGFESRKPIVIAVNGAALGGGLGLVAQGHFVIAEQSSQFCLPEIKVGLWPFLVYRALEVSIGSRRTLALSLTGRTFTAPDALAWGLVHKTCPDNEVYDQACNAARDIAKSCPAAISAGMTYAAASYGKSWHEAGEMASRLRDELMNSGDFKEGVAAFKQRRQPQWPSMPADFYTAKNGPPR